MKTAKKVIKTILALLPLMGLVMLMLTSFNAKSETYATHTKISLVETASATYVKFTDTNALNTKIIGTMFSSDYNTNATPAQENVPIIGAMATIARLGNRLSTITGIPLTFTLITLWYAFYLFLIEMAFMILNIITFIPRKCGEFFGG